MPGVLEEQPIRLPSKVSDLRWQLAIRRPETRRRARPHSLSGSSSVALPAARSARASAASLLRASWEVENWRAQCSSSRSSSSSHWAIRSCSSAGSVASFAIAASNARVIARSIHIVRGHGPTTGYSGRRLRAAAAQDIGRHPLSISRSTLRLLGRSETSRPRSAGTLDLQTELKGDLT